MFGSSLYMSSLMVVLSLPTPSIIFSFIFDGLRI